MHVCKKKKKTTEDEQKLREDLQRREDVQHDFKTYRSRCSRSLLISGWFCLLHTWRLCFSSVVSTGHKSPEDIDIFMFREAGEHKNKVWATIEPSGALKYERIVFLFLPNSVWIMKRNILVSNSQCLHQSFKQLPQQERWRYSCPRSAWSVSYFSSVSRSFIVERAVIFLN